MVTSIIVNQGFAGDWGKLIESYASDEASASPREEVVEALLAAVNESLAKLRSDGTYAGIYAEIPGVLVRSCTQTKSH